MKQNKILTGTIIVAGILAVILVSSPGSFAQPAPGGTVDPTTIPKYVIPLVIPPVMNNDGTAENYDIAVRKFRQQILPGGIWNTINGRNDMYDATMVWSYGPDADPTPQIAPDPGTQFNYPAYTVETMSNMAVNVRWINGLLQNPDMCAASLDPVNDPACNYLPHELPIDQTVHWANPPMVCKDGTTRTDCAGVDPKSYKGPVPIVTHVHGAHVDPHSDGYPEAWWLPAANNIPMGYATSGTLFDDANGQLPAPPGSNSGYADYFYRQDQPATTLWYHDHTLGMTRLNVYVGPAGFWLIRDGMYDGGTDSSTQNPAVLPGPAPVAGEGVLDLNVPGNPVRNKIREIPIVIQDRSFDKNGKKLFYPKHRAFFEGLEPKDLKIPFAPYSDVLPIWNPEAFFNVMVVNGVSWPELEVARDRYRLRLLNGCNSRFLNLALKIVESSNPALIGTEIPFFQIGAEQGFLPKVAMISTGFATQLPGNGTIPAPVPAADPAQALLMGLAERADVIVDFRSLPIGTVVQMTNTAPDAPFGGFGDPPADPGTTGQVMQFVVNRVSGDAGSTDGTTTAPENLVLNAEGPLGGTDVTRKVSLNELESEVVCVNSVFDPDEGEYVPAVPIKINNVPITDTTCIGPDGVPFGPTEALLGTVIGSGASAVGVPLKWTDTTGTSTPVQVTLQSGATLYIPVTENPIVGDTEVWEIYNFTADAHPIHLHLVRFEVVGRTLLDGGQTPLASIQPWETGFKDTVIAYPDEITRVKAKFDIEGLYVWHCHIVEHEDNEMMRPFVVSEAP